MRYGSNSTHMSAYPFWDAVSNTSNGTDTITTVFTADSGRVRITQTTTLLPGNNYYKMQWDITNTGSKTYRNVYFTHGEDTYLDGDDDGYGHFSDPLRMVYVSSVVLGSANTMGLYADPTTPFNYYFEGDYQDNFQRMREWTLNNSVNSTTKHDSGYSIGWKKAPSSSLAPGETWTIIAYEKFISSVGVEVLAPAGQAGSRGGTLEYAFEVRNVTTIPGTFNLTAETAGLWPVSVLDASRQPISSIFLADGARETVYVHVTIPKNVVDGHTERLALSAWNDDDVSTDSTKTTVCGGDFLIDGVEVFAPTGQTGSPDSTVEYAFEVSNISLFGADFDLTAESEGLWAVSILDASRQPISSIYLDADTAATVYVQVTIPHGVANGRKDRLVLYARHQNLVASDHTITTVKGEEIIDYGSDSGSDHGSDPGPSTGLRGNGGCGGMTGNRNNSSWSSTDTGLAAFYLAMLFIPAAVLNIQRFAKKHLCAAKPAFIVLLIAASLTVASYAQAAGKIAIRTQRFNPAMDDLGLLTLESDKTIGFGKVALGLHLNASHTPLNTGHVRGPIEEVLVKYLYTSNFTAAYGVAPNIQLGIDAPLHFSASSINNVSGNREDNLSVGDIRLKAKFSLISGEKFGFALIPFVNFSTGDKDLFLSEGKGAYGITAATRYNITEDLGLYCNIGLEALGNIMSSDSPDYYAQWLKYGFGVSYRLMGGKHRILAEIHGETTLSRTFGHEWYSPIELLAAWRTEIMPGLSLQLGGGTGLNNGMGAPQWRVLAGFVKTIDY